MAIQNLLIADFQLHSKYSRAVSHHMTLPGILTWAKKKGIDLIATGDFTHPLWMKEIEENLEELGNGFLQLKQSLSIDEYTVPGSQTPLFLLATEVSCIYSQSGKGRRIHILIWVPTLESARKINREMTKRGCNLLSDGRPIIGLSSIEVCELVLTIEPQALIIPAHAWTPWFSVFGSMSGFASLEEAFGQYHNTIYAIETGLSSNPAMNWQITELDNRSIVSFSDAHSGPKLGREATVFNLLEVSYQALYDAISARFTNLKQPKGTIAFTTEFYPEEGKYHFSGHRLCNIRWNPEETKLHGAICPVCGKPLIQGVMQRVSELSGRQEADLLVKVTPKKLIPSGAEIFFTHSERFPDRPPFVMLVPLQEIIAESLEVAVTSKKVMQMYDHLLKNIGNEFYILLCANVSEIEYVAGARIAIAVDKVRKGDIYIDPGYDGVFGVVKLWKDDEIKPLVDTTKVQLSMF